MLENNAIEMFRQGGRQIFVHTIISGGQALGDTLKGFAQIAETSTDQNIVVWVNEYFGSVEYNGKPATELKAFRDHAEKVHGWVAIRKRNARIPSVATWKRLSAERSRSRRLYRTAHSRS